MESTVKKPTPQERKEATAELRKKHQPVFEALGIPDAIFIPKMAHHVKDLEGIHMGFFESELKHGQDVYTEMVSMQMESEDVDRRLFKLRGNPHYDEEFAKSNPMPNGHVRYYVPISELEEVKVEEEEVSSDFGLMDPNKDAPLNRLTIRDVAAIHWKKPVSDKNWLNDLIKSLE